MSLTDQDRKFFTAFDDAPADVKRDVKSYVDEVRGMMRSDGRVPANDDRCGAFEAAIYRYVVESDVADLSQVAQCVDQNGRMKK